MWPFKRKVSSASGMQREEILEFKVVLNRAQAYKYPDCIMELCTSDEALNVIADDDTLTLTYVIHVNYFGQVATRLAAITQLLSDPNIVVTASVEELNHGRCLCQDVFLALEKLQATLKKRVKL